MNILNDIVSGASRQFGREFGRAGANAILKGANYYPIKAIDSPNDRIKPSDSSITKAYKQINRLDFVSTNKANVSRLIEITDKVIPFLTFDGIDTLNQLNEIKALIEVYNRKFDHGSALVDEDYQEKSITFLETRRAELAEKLDRFNTDAKSFISKNFEIEKARKKSKKTASILSFPLLGTLGLHKFYLNQTGYGVLYLIFSATFIPAIISLIEMFQFIGMSEENFNQKHNPRFHYFNQFQ